jgi:hypothetical protein
MAHSEVKRHMMHVGQNTSFASSREHREHSPNTGAFGTKSAGVAALVERWAQVGRSQPKRRRFTAEYKLAMVAAYDAATGPDTCFYIRIPE